MKNRLFVLLLLISNVAFSQTGIFTKPNNSYGTIFNRTRVDSLTGIPRDTSYRLSTTEKLEPRWIARQGDSIYVWSIYQNKYVLAGGAGGGGGGYTVLTADTSHWNIAFRLSQKNVYFRNNLTYDTITRKLNDSSLLFKSISITGSGVASKVITDSTIAYVLSGGTGSYTFPNHVVAPSSAIQFQNDSSLAFVTGNNWHYGVRDGRPGWYPDVAASNSIAQTLTSTANVLSLVNDNSTPGANKVYGTSPAAAKGWQPTILVNLSAPALWDLFRYDTTLGGQVVNFRPTNNNGASLKPLAIDTLTKQIYYSNSVSGSGGLDSLRRLEFSVGDLNGPQNGDSTVTHTQFVNRILFVYREGDRQTNTVTTQGITYDNTTGKITFRPILSTGEKIVVDVRDAGNYRNLALEAAGGTSWNTVTWTGNANYINSSNVWTISGSGSSGYGNLAKTTTSVAANTDGAIRIKYNATDAVDFGFGFNTSNATSAISAMPVGAWINGGTVFAREGGAPISTGNVVVGDMVGIFAESRGGSPTFKLKKSTDGGVTWPTVLYTYALTTAGQIWPVADGNGTTGKQYFPMTQGAF